MGSKEQKPTFEEMMAMGVECDQCGGCGICQWARLINEWQPLDGRCTVKSKLGPVRADMPKCSYYVKRGDL